MAHCELSGKSPVVKNLVSHSNIKTKSRAKPNIQHKKFFSLQLRQTFQFKVATSTLRDIDKLGGFDIYMIRQKNSVLSSKALKVKKQILKKTKTPVGKSQRKKQSH